MRNCNSCPVFRFPNKARLFNDRGRLLQNNPGLLKNKGFIETPYRGLIRRLAGARTPFRVYCASPLTQSSKTPHFLFPLGITIVTLKCCKVLC